MFGILQARSRESKTTDGDRRNRSATTRSQTVYRRSVAHSAPTLLNSILVINSGAKIILMIGRVTLSILKRAWRSKALAHCGLQLISTTDELTRPPFGGQVRLPLLWLPHFAALNHGHSQEGNHRPKWNSSKLSQPVFCLLSTGWLLTYLILTGKPACGCVPTTTPATSRLAVCSHVACSSDHICICPKRRYSDDIYPFHCRKPLPALQVLLRCRTLLFPQPSLSPSTGWRPTYGSFILFPRHFCSGIRNDRAFAPSTSSTKHRAPHSSAGDPSSLCFTYVDVLVHGRTVGGPACQLSAEHSSTAVLCSCVPGFGVVGSQHRERYGTSRYTGQRWHSVQLQHRPPAGLTHWSRSCVSHNEASSVFHAWHPTLHLPIGCHHANTGLISPENPLSEGSVSPQRRGKIGRHGRAQLQASSFTPPTPERNSTSIELSRPEHKKLKQLSFAEFKRANMWVEELISEHLVTIKQRGPLNEPPRPGPSSEWEMLAEGRIDKSDCNTASGDPLQDKGYDSTQHHLHQQIHVQVSLQFHTDGKGVLKRQVAGGEGNAFPTLRSNVTIEFTLYSLGGTKITDNRAFNTTMMEFPLANAVPGMQVALTSMRKLERSVFLLAPEGLLPSDFEVTLTSNCTGDTRIQLGSDAAHRGDTATQQSSNHAPLDIRLGSGQWMAFDITMCNIYDKDERWWRMGPDMEFIKELPEESIPSNVTHDEWLEHKADTLRKKIEGEMLTNPNSHYWEDIEPAMTPAQREKIDSYTSRLYGLDKPADPRRDGSRGFRDHTLYRSGGIRHGYEMGDRMTGASRHYVWRETPFSFEIVLYIKEGIRSEHVTWYINSKRMDVLFAGKKVFGDEFVHTIAYKDGASWTLTDAARRFSAMDVGQLRDLYEAVPLFVPTIPSTNADSRESPSQTPDLPTNATVEQPWLPSSYAHPGLLALAPDEVEGVKLSLHHPALHITLQKGRNWTQMWGSPFKYI